MYGSIRGYIFKFWPHEVDPLCPKLRTSKLSGVRSCAKFGLDRSEWEAPHVQAIATKNASSFPAIYARLFSVCCILFYFTELTLVHRMYFSWYSSSTRHVGLESEGSELAHRPAAESSFVFSSPAAVISKKRHVEVSTGESFFSYGTASKRYTSCWVLFCVLYFTSFAVSAAHFIEFSSTSLFRPHQKASSSNSADFVIKSFAEIMEAKKRAGSGR